MKDTLEISYRQIAKGLGVSHSTVGIERKALVSGGRIDYLKESKGQDGKTYPRQRAITTRADEVEKVTEIREGVCIVKNNAEIDNSDLVTNLSTKVVRLLRPLCIQDAKNYKAK
ncbi:MAG: hypothetical protein GY928_14045 [Colwellia sp.]|nr:hypothetical protein [Colwellia sp.]